MIKTFKRWTKPTLVTEIEPDLFEDDIEMQLRAERLQARRWRKLRQQAV